MSRSIQLDQGTAGFTLIEALVALAIVAISLSSIGMLIATTVRGTRTIDHQLNAVETTRGILAALPDRDQLAFGTMSGERADHHWRIDVSPFDAASAVPSQATKWVPLSVVVTVRSPGGGTLRIETIRLRPGAG